MRKEHIQRNIFKYIIAVYVLLILVYLIKFSISIGKKPMEITSQIPQLSVSELEKAYKILEEREDVILSNEVDLNRFQFGKIEPF